MRRLTSIYGCARPNCAQPPVITLMLGALHISYCATHAETKAGQPDAEVTWLSHDYRVCPVCFRVLPRTVLDDGPHFDALGLTCLAQVSGQDPAH